MLEVSVCFVTSSDGKLDYGKFLPVLSLGVDMGMTCLDCGSILLVLSLTVEMGLY